VLAADGLAWGRVSPFEIFLRYGRRGLEPSAVGPWSVKFNQWHDPRDGRFTFGPGGAAMGKRPRPFAGGGGGGLGFDEGGAGGSLEPDAPHSHGPATLPQPHTASSRSPSDATHTVDRNGYRFAIDAEGRTREVTGPLTLGQSGSRSRTEQAGVPDRLASDDGGHYIGARFNGPRDAFNHFAQDSNFNRAGYRALEDQWARAIRNGQSIKVDIVPYYSGPSRRPARLRVSWSIGGNKVSRSFSNRPGGR
jgi:hypothetical protein